ncbi:MAG: aminomethyl-transferring glycine dehydrogenase [Wenzhouxiangellaceae bacterium]
MSVTHQPLPDSPLRECEGHDAFITRHIGPSAADQAAMLELLGYTDRETMMRAILPPGIIRDDAMELPRARGEEETLQRLRAIASQNQLRHNMIGLGYHDTLTPPVIRRNLLENPGWYTAYTPYQAEISQGRLEGLLNYQQMISDLTALPLANASLLDEGTAAAEAMAMLKRINRGNRSRRFLVDDSVLPPTLAVLQTRAEYFDIEIIVGDAASLIDDGDYFGALLSYPGSDGRLGDPRTIIDKAHAQNILVAMACDLLALCLLTPPGELGADVAIGSAQRFGVPSWFGGPHAAFIATRDDYKRNLPGRIIGVSKDRHGRLALRMALQTREQHIRREKAMSNICTAQALLAITSGFYAVYHGPQGLRKIARRVHRLGQILATALQANDYKLRHQAFFDTLFIEISGERRQQLLNAADQAGINLRWDDPAGIGISINEATTREHIEALLCVFGCQQPLLDLDRELAVDASLLPAALQRASDYLSHPVFHSYRSETELMRYMKRLENRDISLMQSMISLGSCTMKLNAAAEMEPISWPEFAQLHPFAPPAQTAGYRQLFAELEQMLVTCTGYDQVSLQPNAGSQGEYAGLLAIRKYHASRGESERDVCLIPSSAHGTNPASAQMMGMRIVVVGCDDHGNIDFDDLKTKAEAHSEKLAALMITYPSTHGVFETNVREVCDLIHQHGGQVYLDGANLNALVGWAGPGLFGADVSHLNLHKTFCIPHGGGGPGVGPICVRQHLAPFLPGHPLINPLRDDGQAVTGAVATAPWGSAGILPISWSYIAMMGRDGLKQATEVAILNANYIAERLRPHYRILYTGRDGRVAHECIVDLRQFKESCGISEEDVAKRLIDFGFHAPTMSWPVPGTLMIEPTESESKAELDRFCDALIAIRAEIQAVADGQLDATDNPLRNAPHTVNEVTADEWTHPYSRQQAAWPGEALREAKYWPPVGRVDNVYGDRNLVCSCPSPEAWLESAATGTDG